MLYFTISCSCSHLLGSARLHALTNSHSIFIYFHVIFYALLSIIRPFPSLPQGGARTAPTGLGLKFFGKKLFPPTLVHLLLVLLCSDLD